MIIQTRQMEQVIVEHLKDGKGLAHLNMLKAEQHFDLPITLFAKIVLNPEDSVGYHTHTDDLEYYIMIEGELVADDNHEKEIVLVAGDVMKTGNGEGHSLENRSDRPAAFWAIVFQA